MEEICQLPDQAVIAIAESNVRIDEKWSEGLGQLNAIFRCKLLVHAATLCLGRVPQ